MKNYAVSEKWVCIIRKRPDQSRYYSPKFIAKIVDEVRKLPKKTIVVNVFPTTNAKRTKKIVGDVFKLADRGNIKKLVVFQQSNKLKPLFSRHKGIGVQFTDEPTGNLDSKASREIIDLLKMSNQKYNQTVIVITHDENIALEADRILTIDDGKIVKDERVR